MHRPDGTGPRRLFDAPVVDGHPLIDSGGTVVHVDAAKPDAEGSGSGSGSGRGSGGGSGSGSGSGV